MLNWCKWPKNSLATPLFTNEAQNNLEDYCQLHWIFLVIYLSSKYHSFYECTYSKMLRLEISQPKVMVSLTTRSHPFVYPILLPAFLSLVDSTHCTKVWESYSVLTPYTLTEKVTNTPPWSEPTVRIWNHIKKYRIVNDFKNLRK